MHSRVLCLSLFCAVLFLPAGLLFFEKVSAEGQEATSDNKLATADKEQVYLQIGIRYQSTRQWEEALKYYEQALEVNPLHIPTHRQIVDLYFAWYKQRKSGGVPTGPIREKAIDSLYKIQALEPDSQASQEMREWEYKIFVDHAKYLQWWLHHSQGSTSDLPQESILLAAENVLLRMQAVDPKNLELQCQLGLTRSILAYLYHGSDNGHELLNEAVAGNPENGFCHEALAMALDMSDVPEKRAQTLHEYVLAIQSLQGEDEDVTLHRSSLAMTGVKVFAKARQRGPGGWPEDLPRFSSIDLSEDKKIEVLNFFIVNNSYDYFQDESGSYAYPLIWLANLYFEIGDYRLAEETFFEQHQKAYQDAGMTREVYERWIESLEKGGHNPERLAEVRQIYKEKYDKAPDRKF